MALAYRPPYRSFDPAQEALEILKLAFGPDLTEQMMRAAYSGSHMLNPYHNVEHELHHVYWAYACAVNSHSIVLSDSKMQNMLFASLFHDHNHSGGTYTDDINVGHARRFALTLAAEVRLDPNQVDANILTTEFTGGKFPHDPQTESQQCMRDADLMMIYTQPGRNVLLMLAEEMGKPWHALDDEQVQRALAANRKFLESADMFTEFGQYTRTTQLSRASEAFEDRVENFRRWSRT